MYEQYRHVKTGGLYEMLYDDAMHTETGEVMVVYRSINSQAVYVRPRQMFRDGRFVKVEGM